jgi:hypothetical protein
MRGAVIAVGSDRRFDFYQCAFGQNLPRRTRRRGIGIDKARHEFVAGHHYGSVFHLDHAQRLAATERSAAIASIRLLMIFARSSAG